MGEPVTRQEIGAALVPLLRAAFQHPVGSRPRRYVPAPEVLERIRTLAREAQVQETGDASPWRVVEGRRWLLNRRLDGRSVPLVQREQTALVTRDWTEAREVAMLLNWYDARPPSRGGLPAYLAGLHR